MKNDSTDGPRILELADFGFSPGASEIALAPVGEEIECDNCVSCVNCDSCDGCHSFNVDS